MCIHHFHLHPVGQHLTELQERLRNGGSSCFSICPLISIECLYYKTRRRLNFEEKFIVFTIKVSVKNFYTTEFDYL